MLSRLTKSRIFSGDDREDCDDIMELWDAYNEKREQLGHHLIRGQVIPSGQYHLCVHVFVWHEDGDILVMKRSSQKELYPNYFEFGAGGSVLAGENSLNAALRELHEETGLIPNRIQLVEQNISYEDQCLFDYYEAQVIGDKESIIYQAGETDAHMWVTPADLSNFCEEHPLFNHQKKSLIKLLKKNG